MLLVVDHVSTLFAMDVVLECTTGGRIARGR